jgi:predicted N-acyltransferase
LTTQLATKIHHSTSELPNDWDTLAVSNVFLSTPYLEVLQQSAPENITCAYIGIYQNENLVGIAISQFIELKKLSNFGERDQCLKTYIRNIAFRNLASNVLLIGNTMLTGQNAFAFLDIINPKLAFEVLLDSIKMLKHYYKSKGKKTHIITCKDFEIDEKNGLTSEKTASYYSFCTQPNMVFEIASTWKTEADYVTALSKKYRDQYKRARKKSEGIEKRKLNLQEIESQEDIIYDLYYHVAKNAPFNTFFLQKNHFSVFKALMKDKFLFYGYFLDDKMIGFNTLIKNGTAMETYFLGYDDTIQKDKMLYLNMLYDMIGFSIKKEFKKIIFARTALEIKSSVGAQPIAMYGFIKHENKLLNGQMETLFKYLEPKTIWKERNPFK